jgi:hypothetical protein
LSKINDKVFLSLAQAPVDRPVSLLMRHAHRYPIADLASVFTTPLTPEGVKLAGSFGKTLGQKFQPGRVISSPVGRCLATGMAIVRGAGWDIDVHSEDRLSDPHIQPALKAYSSWYFGQPLPFAVQEVLGLMLEGSGSPSLDLLVTHDTVVACLVSFLLSAPVADDYWPDFFEGLFLWQEAGVLQAVWRGRKVSLPGLKFQPGLFWRGS